ncbi:hypothetical protein FSP39_006604 [Pinctada imbricata]|uniref:G-protein coupled receptors family 1 profile domain-containing protein n=1 Tax=Pinctada imbricata TaxID=66713 RepID=A0AA88XXH9_PINIB|nr:hypothetical protein FSP39_006604 [Pinctada imbricata]
MNSTTDSLPIEYDSLKPVFPDIGHFTVGGVLATVFVCGTIANGCGLITFFKTKHLRSPTNTFIISLLVGDFCMCFFGIPMAMSSSFKTHWLWGTAGCNLEGFLVYFFGCANMYTLCAISMDRYVVIAMPLHSSKITHRVAKLSVLLCWTLGFFWAVVPFFGWSYYDLEAAHTSCAVVWESHDPVVVSYNITIFVFVFFIPVLVMMFAYVNVYLTIRNVARNNVWDMTSRIARKNLAIEKKMFKTILIMVGVFLFAWTPYAVVSFWAAFIGARGIPVAVQTVPAMAAKCSSVCDPFIYVVTNKQFRKAFYKIIPCAGLRQKLEEIEDREPEKSGEDSGTYSKSKKQVEPPKKVNMVQPIEEDEVETQVDTIRSSPGVNSQTKRDAIELEDINEGEQAQA